MTPSNHSVSLNNGWRADFLHKGEFKMACEGWGLVLTGPQERQITFLSEMIVLVNDWDGETAKTCIKLTEDGKKGYLEDGLSGAWVIDFENLLLAPHRWYISHNWKGKYLSAYEQPCYKGVQDYLTVDGRLIYITFPLLPEDLLQPEIDQYLALRRRQLEETYFIKK